MTIENHVRLYEVLRVCMRDNRCNDAKTKRKFTNHNLLLNLKTKNKS